MKLPTIKQLRYFVALTETEHFGRAAEACFVSQSAFSNAIQELEGLLEVQLAQAGAGAVNAQLLGVQQHDPPQHLAPCVVHVQPLPVLDAAAVVRVGVADDDDRRLFGLPMHAGE